jgi:hypothetical protein
MAKAKKRNDAGEDRKLGNDERFVARVDRNEESRVDEALGLQMISIRLPKRLIERLKLIAKHNGIGYQPLIRDVLSHFARGELIQVLRQQSEIADLESRRSASSKTKKTGRERKAA